MHLCKCCNQRNPCEDVKTGELLLHTKVHGEGLKTTLTGQNVIGTEEKKVLIFSQMIRLLNNFKKLSVKNYIFIAFWRSETKPHRF